MQIPVKKTRREGPMKLRAFLAMTVFASALPALAAPNCGPNYMVVGPNCAFSTNYAWAAAGGGANSILTFYVPPRASGPVSFQFTGLNSSLGSTYAGFLGVMAGEIGKGCCIVFTPASPQNPQIVNPGQAKQILINQVCFDPTCTAAAPAGAVGNMFSAQLLVLSPNPADLNVTPNPQLTIQFLNGNQVTFEETSNARGVPGLNTSLIPGISLGATPAGRYVYNGAAVTEPFDEFSITNESAAGPITGSVTIEDSNSNPIVMAPIPAIPPSGAAGFLVIGRFPGDALGLFDSSTVLPAGADGIFHGILVVNMTGPNIVTAQELYGNAFLNLLVFH
jgi:hypothetical protein